MGYSGRLITYYIGEKSIQNGIRFLIWGMIA